jgi:hypothetical protein
VMMMMIVTIVMMVITMMIAVPSCGWSRTANCDLRQLRPMLQRSSLRFACFVASSLVSVCWG